MLAQHDAYLSTGKKPTLGALLEAAWQSATGLGKILPGYSGKTLIDSPSTIQALAAIDAAIAALEGARRALGATNNGSDRTLDNDIVDAAAGIARASAELGGGGESVAEDRDGVTKNGGGGATKGASLP